MTDFQEAFFMFLGAACFSWLTSWHWPADAFAVAVMSVVALKLTKKT